MLRIDFANRNAHEGNLPNRNAHERDMGGVIGCVPSYITLCIVSNELKQGKQVFVVLEDDIRIRMWSSWWYFWKTHKSRS